MKLQKKLYFLLITIALSLALFGTVASAAKPSIASTRYYMADTTTKKTFGYYRSYSCFKGVSGDRIISVKSSNRKVVSISKNGTRVTVTPKKPGTATLKIKIRRKGKTYTLKQKARIYDFKPFKSIKWGRTKLGIKDFLVSSYALMDDETPQILSITMNSGWKIKKIVDENNRLYRNNTRMKPDIDIYVYYKKDPTHVESFQISCY